MSFCWTSLRMTMGCWHGLALSSLRKYGLHADRTTLWAVKEQPSQANVTSTKSSSSLKCRNDDSIDEWKSFHRSEYCCSGEVSPPIGQSEGAISTPMVMPFWLHHWNFHVDVIFVSDLFRKKGPIVNIGQIFAIFSTFTRFFLKWYRLFSLSRLILFFSTDIND